MDAVRADHLSCYGYRRKTSLNIDMLVEEGVLFENAFSAAEWSPPSHASIFTGKYPSFHRTLGKEVSLHSENTTLAEILSKNGYQTFGVTSNPLMSPASGFSKGFQKYFVLDAPYRSFRFIIECPKDFIRTLIWGLDWYTYRNIQTIKKLLSKRDKSKPFFLFTNILTCHSPYDPPRPFKKLFCSSLKEPRFYMTEVLLKNLTGKTGEKICYNDLSIEKLNYIASDPGQKDYIEKKISVSSEEWEVVKSWYDGAISYQDFRIGELIDFLHKEGLFDNTLLIITSDHGENFGEHGFASHQFCLYDSLIHVPLIMVNPNTIPKNKRFTQIVSTIDIYSTILNVLNINYPQDDIQAKSLYPFKDRKIHDFICAESGESVTEINTGLFASAPRRPGLKKFDKGHKCLRNESFKYILSSDQKEELYDIRIDPLEKINLIDNYPEKAKYLKKLLKKTIDASFFGADDIFEKDEENIILNRLKALGYIE